MPSPDRASLGAVALALLVLAAGTTFASDAAGDRALAAEQAFLEDRLAAADCLDSYGTGEVVVSERARVVGVRPTGLVVDVRHPYALSTGRLEADAVAEARYLVGPDAVRRLDGDEIDPC
ncbi:hypothetical protein [Halobaculum lipolyticum]|uniref:Uncharacterized protein n=1 Tax=Halobaculum lipolyticum TaxID=3032001 RepID=A0ABD5WE20_9EURY|nr:hypothetical protein [Halobaculum sp. DT31]